MKKVYKLYEFPILLSSLFCFALIVSLSQNMFHRPLKAQGKQENVNKGVTEMIVELSKLFIHPWNAIVSFN